MDTTLVSRTKWRLVLAALALTVVGGTVITIALANGAANPPRASALINTMNDDTALRPFGSLGEVELYGSTTPLIEPLTIEMNASNNGSPQSAWGIWLRVLDRANTQDWSQWWIWVVDNQGYMSISHDEEPLVWSEFIHIRSRGENKLYLNFEANGTTTFRINNEIAWTGELPSEYFQWGVAHYKNPSLLWGEIRLYGG